MSGEMLPGLKIVEHIKHKDDRGDFSELWKTANDNMRGTFRQLNCATSKQYVLRGMHKQDQTKLVMPVDGEIFDVALDPVTGKWFGILLDNSESTSGNLSSGVFQYFFKYALQVAPSFNALFVDTSPCP
jgi:dTDP-4-dehydrorhamnose 3,5-epimerase-like enzyme